MSITIDDVIISNALSKLERLSVDCYIIAFGPNDKQFVGTSNGFAANFLPEAVLAEVVTWKRINWVAFGEDPESYFFSFELQDGATNVLLGPGAPKALGAYINQVHESKSLSSLRLQFGPDGSFVVWSKAAWACYGVPESLRYLLRAISSHTKDDNNITEGSLKTGPLKNIQWHSDCSYYFLSGTSHFWNFPTRVLRQAWGLLWDGTRISQLQSNDLIQLAHVAINPYTPTSTTFTFLKKELPDLRTPFIIQFGDKVTMDLPPKHRAGQCLLLPDPDERQHFQWATSKKSGRPHPGEARELELTKGQKIKVLTDMGRDWHICVARNGMKGWAHGSWLDFGNRKLHQDPKVAFEQFNTAIRNMFVTQLQEFPAMNEFMDMCTLEECNEIKSPELLGICLHDLQALLEGSNRYSYAWLKEERNLWHPDRFARFCVPERAGELKIKAEQMFVLYGVLMEGCA